MTRTSLRARLALGAVLFGLGALLLAGAAFTAALRNHIETRAERILREDLDALSSGLAQEPGSTRREASWQLEVGGRCVRTSSSLERLCLNVPEAPLGAVRLVLGPDDERMLASSRRISTTAFPEARLVVAVGLDDLDAEHFVFERRLSIGLSAMGLVLLGAGAWCVRLGLAPLGRLSAALAEVRRAASRRVEGEYPDEIQPLVDDLNGLLAHDDDLIARARAQAENLAHGLKTPLAILANEAEGMTGARNEQSAETIREQVLLMAKRIDGQLARARAAAAGRTIGLRADVATAVERIERTMRRIFEGRALRIDARVEPPCQFRGEPFDLEEILGNLLENACRWAASRVTLLAVTENDAIRITVEDDGPGLAPEAREDAFARGFSRARLDEAQPSSGLGLAIVRELVELYGGSITLGDATGGGLQVDLRLPAA